MFNAEKVAKYFYKLAVKENKPLTHMKIQKLVFFAHGVHLAAFETPLITENVKAWKYGPVIPELYDYLYTFGKSPVTIELQDHELDELENDQNAIEASQVVWEAFKDDSAWRLSEISHAKDSPWDVVWNHSGNELSTIPNTLIEDYYKKFVSAD